MYRDLYLKFDSEAQAQPYLYEQVVTKWSDDEPPVPVKWDWRPRFLNIDILGVLYEAHDPQDPTPPVPLPGWHVNVRAMPDEDVSALESFKVYPQLPRRVWG